MHSGLAILLCCDVASMRFPADLHLFLVFKNINLFLESNLLLCYVSDTHKSVRQKKFYRTNIILCGFLLKKTTVCTLHVRALHYYEFAADVTTLRMPDEF